MASNIGLLWKKGDYNIRKKIQKLAYPNGIFYDKENQEYRTDGENKVFELFNKISSTYDGINKSDNPFLLGLSDVVEHIGPQYFLYLFTKCLIDINLYPIYQLVTKCVI